MLAVERTTRAFVASVQAALPAQRTSVSRSKNRAGRSNYVYIYCDDRWHRTIKVRISDHGVGMARALRRDEALLLRAGATIDHWSVWLSTLVRELANPSLPEGDR